MYGVKVAGMEFETDLTTKAVNGSHFDLVAVGNDTNTSADVHNLTGAQIETNSQKGHVTGFERPEDGAWDTIDHNKFYFVSTASITGHSKLWELDFTDAKNPTLGGTVKMLLDGTEGQLMFDNIARSARTARSHCAKILETPIASRKSGNTIRLTARSPSSRITIRRASIRT